MQITATAPRFTFQTLQWITSDITLFGSCRWSDRWGHAEAAWLHHQRHFKSCVSLTRFHYRSALVSFGDWTKERECETTFITSGNSLWGIPAQQQNWSLHSACTKNKKHVRLSEFHLRLLQITSVVGIWPRDWPQFISWLLLYDAHFNNKGKRELILNNSM